MAQRVTDIRTSGTKYRPDIDGLRAIAVLGVLAFHVRGGSLLPGGFLGVDVFFVISGYLIAQVILSQLQTRTFSFKTFYFRRFRRLFPAFASVLFVSSVMAWFILQPARLQDFASASIASVFGLSNFYLLSQDSYWAFQPATQPLLHTWSLSVEEQFYAFFPLLLYFLVTRLHSLGRVAKATLAIAVASLTLSMLLSLVNPDLSFFLPFTRAWELLAGVVLALYVSSRKPVISPHLSGILSGAGIGMILISFVWLGKFITFPGLLTLIPVIGTIMILLGGLRSNPVSQLLGIKPLVGLGLISYSLYLWHYPLLAFPAAVFTGLRWFEEGIAVGIAVVAATVTYWWVERPVRRVTSVRAVVVPSVALASAIVLFAGISIPDGLRSRISGIPDVNKSVETSIEDVVPRLASLSAEIDSIVVVGDSHMGDLLTHFNTLGLYLGVPVSELTAAGCPLYEGVEGASKSSLESDGCSLDYQRSRFEEIEETQPSVVVLGGRFPTHLENDLFDNGEGGYEGGLERFFRNPETIGFDENTARQETAEALTGAISRVSDNAGLVVIIYPRPEAGWIVPDEIFRRSAFSGFSWPLTEPVSTSYDLYLERTRTSWEALDAVSASNVIRIYPHLAFCDTSVDGRCQTHSSNEIWYRDASHLSPTGSWKVFESIVGELTKY